MARSTVEPFQKTEKIMRTVNLMLALAVVVMVAACGEQSAQQGIDTGGVEGGPGQSAVVDPNSKPTVVQIAVGSKDHSTLVTAVKTAGLVDVLSNVGPFTVFAPVNSAFDALPAGTVESLLKPENKAQLTNILEYHVYVGVIGPNLMRDGMSLNQVNGKNIKITKDGDKFKVNNATIVASVEASNGIVHVIDGVLLPE
jgi:uncharacterized surface protein with fasciclin (FAS1) repeats